MCWRGIMGRHGPAEPSLHLGKASCRGILQLLMLCPFGASDETILLAHATAMTVKMSCQYFDKHCSRIAK